MLRHHVLFKEPTLDAVPNLYFMIAKGTLGQQTGEQDLPV
jgi:hypothetical protein